MVMRGPIRDEVDPYMLGWFRALMPKEERFFDLFERHSAIVVSAAEALRALVQGGDDAHRYCAEIFKREAEADEVTREVLTAVRRAFITPFDRTDIQDFISSMDDAIDQMNSTAKTIVLFEVHKFEPQMRQMTDVILEAAKLVHEAMPLLRAMGANAGRLNVITARIIGVEEQADDICNQGLKALFLANRGADGKDARAPDVMSFIIGSEVYDHLEKIVDRFEAVANEISSIVIDEL
jgi:uncharacterized protein